MTLHAYRLAWHGMVWYAYGFTVTASRITLKWFDRTLNKIPLNYLIVMQAYLHNDCSVELKRSTYTDFQ